MYILKKGYEVQKKSVVSNLHHYLKDAQSNKELLPLLLNSIETWDTEFQCLLAQSLCIACDSNQIEGRNLCKAISLSVDFVDNLNNDQVYNSWREAFPKLAY